MSERLAAREHECERFDVTVRLREGATTLDETVLEGACIGACTVAAKDEGAARVEEIQRRIDRGEATESELDYNFTDCQVSGPRAGRIDAIDGRDVALLDDHYIGPHSVPGGRFVLAIEHCAKLFVSSPFGETYVGGWKLDDLRIEHRAGTLVVEGVDETRREPLYRLRLPRCPAPPVEDVVAP